MLQLTKAIDRNQRKRGGTRHAVQRPHTAASRKAGMGYFYLGVVLLALFLVQQFGGLRWPWLGRLQADGVYTQISGFTLLAFIAHQWHFSVLRARGLMHLAGRLAKGYKLIGAMAPVFFFLHSQRIGYAYLAVLSVVFLAIFVTGLLNFEILGVRGAWFRAVWITLHVGLATALLFLVGYHVFITYAYQ